MFPRSSRNLCALLTILTAPMLIGCSDSERVADVALAGSKRQADLDQEMIHLNREVAAGTSRLVEAQGQADQKHLSAQQDLQQQRDALETERRQLAERRNAESLLAPIFLTLGSLLICSLPLVLCWYLLRELGSDPAELEVTQLFIDQLSAQEEHEPRNELSPPELKPGLRDIRISWKFFSSVIDPSHWQVACRHQLVSDFFNRRPWPPVFL